MSSSSGSYSFCGNVVGTRVPMRMTSTCGMSRRPCRKNLSFVYGSGRGSPPETMPPRPARGRGRGAAARDDDVANFAVGADVVEHALVVAADGVPAAADHGGALARAEPA